MAVKNAAVIDYVSNHLVMLNRVYVGLGSNLDDPAAHIRRACQELGVLPGTCCSQYSRLFKSAPHGPADQPDYINAVAELETELTPSELLIVLQALEQQHGRVRTEERWGPRPLDLDILLYGDLRINTSDLQVPHPRMTERPFVLYPLQELEPDLNIPGLGALSELLQNCPIGDLEPVDDLQI